MACHNGKRKHRFIRYIVAGIITAYSIASLLYLHFAGDKYSERRDGRERSDVPIQNRSHDLKRTSYSLTVENVSKSCEKKIMWLLDFPTTLLHCVTFVVVREGYQCLFCLSSVGVASLDAFPLFLLYCMLVTRRFFSYTLINRLQ